MSLRRLTRAEYDNVAKDLLAGKAMDAAASLPADNLGSAGFSTPGLISDVDVAAFRDVAERLANAAVLDVKKLTGCADMSDACAEAFVSGFGRRAFRRPMAPPEAELYRGLFRHARGALAYDVANALRVVLVAYLQSPSFLYRAEIGCAKPTPEGGLVRLNAHEMASRLSFFLWSSMPDAELFAAADANALETPAQIEAQARRLLMDDRARRSVDAFYREWLELQDLAGATKDPALYPRSIFGPHVTKAMEDETLDFGRRVTLREAAGDLRMLLLGSFASVDDGVGRIYGLTLPMKGTHQVTLPAAERPGILSRTAFLTSTANAYEGDPTKRGLLVRTRLLCQSLPPPPDDVPSLPTLPDATVRERHEKHFESPACSGCHLLTDRIGFGFGNYDAIGRYVTSEKGKPIDASGKLVAVDGKDRDFRGLPELTEILAASAETQRCFARQWIRFALRRAEVASDEASVTEIHQAFARSGFNIRELLVEIAKSRLFRFRTLAAGEVLP